MDINLKKMNSSQLESLCNELRQEIIQAVSINGGHLASSLGAVELCVALHRNFNLDGDDRVFFDVGHQAYAHKLLTGRKGKFQHLRQMDGCSGFVNPSESDADPAFAGHAGVALSQAIGAAKAMELTKRNGHVIAVIGDGSLSCGLIWEALNNIRYGGKRLIIILNDNQMSISPTGGCLRKCLNKLIVGRFYNRIRRRIERQDGSTSRLWNIMRRIEHGLKGMLLSGSTLFQEFGLRYIGPIDGHDIAGLCDIFRHIPTNSQHPILLHVVTQKGHGYHPAEEDPVHFHCVSKFDAASGKLPAAGRSYSAAFGDALLALAKAHDDVTAVSAAMLDGTGLETFAHEFPNRCFDVGIAEEHAVVFASGMATQGLRPIVTLYSTFLQRALDCVYHDICLNRLPVILAIDRTGTVPDGPTHHGIYALPFLRGLPNLTILAPADEEEMAAMLNYAYNLNAPALLRYPRGKCIDTLKNNDVTRTPIDTGRALIVRDTAAPTLTLWATGAEIATAWDVADILERKDNTKWRVQIVNARFLKPFDVELAQSFAKHQQAVIDDYTTDGGLADCLNQALNGIEHKPVRIFAYPSNEVICHGTAAQLRDHYGLTAAQIAAALAECGH